MTCCSCKSTSDWSQGFCVAQWSECSPDGIIKFLVSVTETFSWVIGGPADTRALQDGWFDIPAHKALLWFNMSSVDHFLPLYLAPERLCRAADHLKSSAALHLVLRAQLEKQKPSRVCDQLHSSPSMLPAASCHVTLWSSVHHLWMSTVLYRRKESLLKESQLSGHTSPSLLLPFPWTPWQLKKQ